MDRIGAVMWDRNYMKEWNRVFPFFMPIESVYFDTMWVKWRAKMAKIYWDTFLSIISKKKKK